MPSSEKEVKLLDSALSVSHDLRTLLAGNAGASAARSSAPVNHPSSTGDLTFRLEDRNGFKAKKEASIFTADQG